ncbi:MAG: YafY family protein [Pseudomonadota bacterium]
MRRADRLIKIVHYLRRRRHAVTARQIADDFEICQRTVYRDIQDLMNSGVPIYGEAGVGYIIDKQYHLPPVMFDFDELEAIALGIQMVQTWTDEPFSEVAESALDKIKAVLPASRLEDMQQLTTHSEASNSKIVGEVRFSDIRACIRARKKIDFQYTDLNDKTTSRTVRPLSLVFFGPVWLVIGWCELRKDFRNFRLDRMAALAVPGTVFQDEKGKTLKAYLAQCRI